MFCFCSSLIQCFLFYLDYGIRTQFGIGDTLGKIAARYGTTVEAIATLNGIQDANVIGVDQVLILPGNEQGN